MKIKEFLIKNKEISQLVYGIILIVLIPLLIAYNTLIIVKNYNKNIDVSLQRQALSVSRTISSLLRNDLSNKEKLQENIGLIKLKNTDVEEISVLEPAGDNFKIVVSSNKEDLNKIYEFYYYKLAWTQPENDALATDSLRLSTDPEQKETFQNINKEDRFWLVAMPMRDFAGDKKFLLSIKLSSKIVDDLTKQNRNTSLYFLVGTVIIVILFLSVAVRLWDYAILYKKIKEVDQMKDEFVSMASHELRTPITGINGYISMMLDESFGQINEKLKESLLLVKNSASRLAVLVEDLLNVSRIEQGRIQMEIKPTDPVKVIEETIREFSPQAMQKNIQLIFIAKNLPMINVDEDRFKQVLINLIGNAVKYTEKGSVELMAEEKDSGKILEFTVKDTGIGMSAQERQRLFEKFYRIQNKKTKNISGTGLGLWITKKIIELMGGKLHIDSIEGVGTQATFSFPVAKQ